MTSSTHPALHQLDDLRTEWRMIARSRDARSAALLVVQHHGAADLAALGVDDLADLVRLLEPSSCLDQIGRSHLVATLLTLAPSDALIRRTLLQTLLPGIVSVARRLRWGASTGEEPAVFLADLITAAYELIVEWGGQERPYAAPDLLNALRCRMRRRLETTKRLATQSLDLDDGQPRDEVASHDPDPWATIEGLLRELGDECDRLGAAALYGREVLGYSYRELATMTGVPARTLSAASKSMARRILQ